MATPSVSGAGAPAMPQARYERTTIPVATAEAIIDATKKNIIDHTTRGSTFSSESSVGNGKKVVVERITPLYPANPKDTYIQMGMLNTTAKGDATMSYAWSTMDIETAGFIVNGIKINAFGTGDVKAFQPNQNPDVDTAWMSEKSAAFDISRDQESCSIGVAVMTEDPNPTEGRVSENCSFLDGAQALALAQQIAQQVR